MVPYSPRPAARERPLPTCDGHYLAGRDLRSLRRLAASSSGSGLAANRKNRLPPRGSILPSTASRSPRPAGCYDPRHALRPWVSRTWTVTWLEPRTRYQPGKLKKVSKNDEPFTPAEFDVNRFCTTLCGDVSSCCNPSTGPWCRIGAVSRFLRSCVPPRSLGRIVLI